MKLKKPGSIWFRPTTIEEMNRRNENTLATHLHIRCTEIGNDFLKGEMEVTTSHFQPNKIMNGGASCVFAETIASTAANYCIDNENFLCLGVSISANHIKAAKEGKLFCIARPEHRGRTTQIWQIKIYDEKGSTIALATLTLLIVPK